MLKGMQELSKKNDELGMINDELKAANTDLKAKTEAMEERLAKVESLLNLTSISKQQSISLTNGSLEQNVPNPPVGHFTKISYTLPAHTAKATIVVSDNSGKIIQQISLDQNSKGSVNVNTAGLSAGAYSYSLYADGRLIETKKMVVSNN